MAAAQSEHDKLDSFPLTLWTQQNGYFPKRWGSTRLIHSAVAAPAPSACQVPSTPFACWGNANKDVFHGAPINNLDVSMFKNIPIRGERLWAQFRVEAYNVLNHTQFTTVNTTAQFNPTTGAQTNPLFGQYTATAAPRRLQLALRVSF